MPATSWQLTPHSDHQPTSVRRIYVQNLTDLLHACLLRGENTRARRAWSILVSSSRPDSPPELTFFLPQFQVRCREVDWRSRWYWGLKILSVGSNEADTSSALQPPNTASDTERWLKNLRASAREEEKPALLHAIMLQYLKIEQFRPALDELETYLPSYPYILSGPLHTYAGMLAFYLAQPAAAQRSVLRQQTSANENGSSPVHRTTNSTRASVDSEQSDLSYITDEPPNPALLRQARSWFAKALDIDRTDEIAREFIQLIDRPRNQDFRSDLDKTEDSKSANESSDSDDVEVDERSDHSEIW